METTENVETKEKQNREKTKKEKRRRPHRSVSVKFSALTVLLAFIAGYLCCNFGIITIPWLDSFFGIGDSGKVTVFLIEEKLQEIGEFSTQEYVYTITYNDEKAREFKNKFKIPFTKKTIEVIGKGTIKVGCKMSDVKVFVKKRTKTITVILPQMQVNSNEVTELLCREKNNILNPINFKQYQDAVKNIKERGLEQAKENNIFVEARNSTQNQIRELLSCFEKYTVKFG